MIQFVLHIETDKYLLLNIIPHFDQVPVLSAVTFDCISEAL